MEKKEPSGFIQLLYPIFLLAIIIIIIKGCDYNPNANIYTEKDYYRDNPNATKSYEEFLKEEQYIQDLKEEIKKRQGN